MVEHILRLKTNLRWRTPVRGNSLPRNIAFLELVFVVVAVGAIPIVIMAIGIISLFYNTRNFAILDIPTAKIMYGFYLLFLWHYSNVLSHHIDIRDIACSVFLWIGGWFIMFGISQMFGYSASSTLFSSPQGEVLLLMSLIIPYAYGNIWNSLFEK